MDTIGIGRARRTQMAMWHLAVLFLVEAGADRLFSPGTGTMFGRNSREPKYKIEFHAEEAPFHPFDGQESMTMSNMDGKKYLCFLPVIVETKSRPVTHSNNSGILVRTDRPTKLKTPDELLDVHKDECMIRHEGWWTYEFCYKDKIRQLHLDNSKVIQEFILGKYDPEATFLHNQNHSESMLKNPHSKDDSQRFHAHLYTNGTMCDLTNQLRETEIRFVCSDSATMVTSIKEISTCKYAVTIQSSALCKHPLFQQERPTWHTIHCNELQAEVELSEFHSSREKRISIVADDAGRYAT